MRPTRIAAIIQFFSAIRSSGEKDKLLWRNDMSVRLREQELWQITARVQNVCNIFLFWFVIEPISSTHNVGVVHCSLRIRRMMRIFFCNFSHDTKHETVLDKFFTALPIIIPSRCERITKISTRKCYIVVIKKLCSNGIWWYVKGLIINYFQTFCGEFIRRMKWMYENHLYIVIFIHPW